MHNFKTAKQNVLQYLETIEVSKEEATKRAKLSKGYFTKEFHMNTKALEKIKLAYPQLNLNWVVTSKGKMMLEKHEQ